MVLAVSAVSTVRIPVVSTFVTPAYVPSSVHVTVCGGALVPVTVAVSCTLDPLATSGLVESTVTAVTVGGAVTLTFLEALTVVLALEVAITFRLVAVSPGATVSKPAALMAVLASIAPLTVQVTSCEGVPVPVTAAANWSVAPTPTELALPAAEMLTPVTTGIDPDTVTVAVAL